MKSNSAIQMKRFSETATGLNGNAMVEISGALRKLLADVFTLYLKTKNFHWHMSGKHSATITYSWMSTQHKSLP
jgi:starvation-inducible DNA-binding protein